MRRISIFIFSLMSVWMFSACSDILDTESSRQNIEPGIASKTDSLFYGVGVLQAMQELADQYVLLGEMRGDLVATTRYTDNNLRQLYDFSYDDKNKYDSAYLYYRVINNCNYFIAHRDTALYTGSTNVAIQEYAAIMAIRAWAYLQLGRNYEKVPFFTMPLTEISQIDDNNFPMLDLAGIVNELAPGLEKFTKSFVPNYGITGNTGHNIGSLNSGGTKSFFPELCFIPVDVILGDMYLETNQYAKAASHYVTYLTEVSNRPYSNYTSGMRSKNTTGRMMFGPDPDLPNRSLFSDRNYGNIDSWSPIFATNVTQDIITYIPMAVNSRSGCITGLPLIFGYDYYATAEETSENSRGRYVDEVQLLPSQVLNTLSDSTEFYYYVDHDNSRDLYDSIAIHKAGDMRLRSILLQYYDDETDATMQWITKFNNGNIILYRTSTVLLHLAEAFNRLEMPDAAFAILKDGISTVITDTVADGTYTCSYITDATRNNLKTVYPFFSDQNKGKFEPMVNGVRTATGIHCHGAGFAAGDFPASTNAGGSDYHDGKSPYNFNRMTGLKLDEIAKTFGVAVGTTKQDTINAVEDLLCDEYALELAFEGCRFYDLCRLARHKNASALYGANFGSEWLARKLAFKNPQRDLRDEKNWYLPFK